MKKISRESLAVLIISAATVTANSWHVIAAWFAQPAGTYFTGISHYYADYFLYVSLMTQKGLLFTEHLFTNEPLGRTWIYWMYTILGKFGNPFIVYNVSIVIFSAILLFVWWLVIQSLTESRFSRTVSFLFIATASGFAGYDFWFSPLPALNRLGGVPHQIVQTILFMLLILLFHRKKYWLMSIVSFIAATSNPIQMLLLGAAFAATNPRTIPFLLPAALGAWITNREFDGNQILTAAKVWENSQSVSVNLMQFLLAVGPIAVLVPFGIRDYIRDLSPVRKAIALFTIFSLFMFFSPIPGLLGTSPVRWLSPASYALLPILAAFGMKKYRTVFLVIYLFLAASSLITQVNARINAPEALNYVAIDVVQKLTDIHEDGVVLTNPAVPYDMIVPVFTGRKTFTGHPIHTLYPDVKEALRRKYFDGRMTEEEKQNFLKDHSITTIFP